MKLDDFLKCKKVRAIRNYGQSLTEGKEYMISSVDYISVSDNDGDRACLDSDLFEPVLDSAENPLQGVELTPEFEVVEPKFKVGDKVYYRGDEEIYVVSDVSDFGDVQIKYWREDYHNSKYFCHATQENYERLQATFPDIEFERPPKPLTGIELAKKLIAKGHNYLVVDTVIGIRVATKIIGNTLFDSNGTRIDELDDITPLDDVTGKPLTQAVLDE